MKERVVSVDEHSVPQTDKLNVAPGGGRADAQVRGPDFKMTTVAAK